jgi:hypothetical protein
MVRRFVWEWIEHDDENSDRSVCHIRNLPGCVRLVWTVPLAWPPGSTPLGCGLRWVCCPGVCRQCADVEQPGLARAAANHGAYPSPMVGHRAGPDGRCAPRLQGARLRCRPSARERLVRSCQCICAYGPHSCGIPRARILIRPAVQAPFARVWEGEHRPRPSNAPLAGLQRR